MVCSGFFNVLRLLLIFGKPFQLPSNEEKLSRENATTFIMEHITDLLPAEYHGVYAESEK